MPTPTPEPAPTYGAGALLVSLQALGHITNPLDTPDVFITDDGWMTFIEYRTATDTDGFEYDTEHFVSRRLTPAGVEWLRQELLTYPELANDADFGREPLPGVEVPGMGIDRWAFMSAADGSPARVTSIAVHDFDEQYWTISEQRQRLHDLAIKLRYPPGWIPEELWAGPEQPGRIGGYVVDIDLNGGVPVELRTDITVAEVELPFDPYTFGREFYRADSGEGSTWIERCGSLDVATARELMARFDAADTTRTVAGDEAVFGASLYDPTTDTNISIALRAVLPGESFGCESIHSS